MRVEDWDVCNKQELALKNVKKEMRLLEDRRYASSIGDIETYWRLTREIDKLRSDTNCLIMGLDTPEMEEQKLKEEKAFEDKWERSGKDKFHIFIITFSIIFLVLVAFLYLCGYFKEHGGFKCLEIMFFSLMIFLLGMFYVIDE